MMGRKEDGHLTSAVSFLYLLPSSSVSVIFCRETTGHKKKVRRGDGYAGKPFLACPYQPRARQAKGKYYLVFISDP